MRAVVIGIVLAVLLSACGSRGGQPLTAPAPSGPSPTSPATASPSAPASPSPSPSPSPVAPSPSPSPSPVAAGRDAGVLSPCSSSGDAVTETVLVGDGPRPSDADIDAALTERPDLREYVRSLESEGVTTADARHAAYAQVLADAFFQYAQSFPNYVEGRVAGYPASDEPFTVTFAGAVPVEFDPTGYGLESYGLEVTSGVAGTHEEVFDEAFSTDVWEAARAAGLVVRDVVDDINAGTLTVQVVAASPEQVATFEAELDQPDRVCLVLVEPDVPCDDAVVAAARERAQRQGEVVTGTSSDVAEAVERSHLGLTADESRSKAEQEGRRWRLEAEEGVAYALTSDAVPGRLGVTICQGVVVAASMEFYD